MGKMRNGKVFKRRGNFSHSQAVTVRNKSTQGDVNLNFFLNLILNEIVWI